MGIVRSLALGGVVASAACGAFGTVDGAPQTPPDAAAPTTPDAGDAAAAPAPDAAITPAELDGGSGIQDADGADALTKSGRFVVQAHVVDDLGAGPAYDVQFPLPTTVGNLPMIAIASRGASTLELPTKPVSGGTEWAGVASSKDHVATAVYIGPSGASASEVSFSFGTAPADLVVLLMEWKLADNVTYSSANYSSAGTSTLSFVGVSATVPEIAKNPVVIDIAGVNLASVTAAPAGGFLGVTLPASQGQITLVAAYRSMPDTQSYAASYALGTSSAWDALSMKFHALP